MFAWCVWESPRCSRPGRVVLGLVAFDAQYVELAWQTSVLTLTPSQATWMQPHDMDIGDRSGELVERLHARAWVPNGEFTDLQMLSRFLQRTGTPTCSRHSEQSQCLCACRCPTTWHRDILQAWKCHLAKFPPQHPGCRQQSLRP